ncbi:MAG TPA: c-type cytochrome domain-containing protein [Verrucomicrobiae bacterium]|nr:c-type cytochrome domain-containing protein [Verrucomicrobiae bacterium]
MSFRQEVAPILVQKCLACHGPDKTKGNFRLDTYEWLAKGGASKEPVFVPGPPAGGKLLQLLETKDPDDRMPQKDDPLPPAQIHLIERWVGEGAKFDGPDPKAPLIAIIPRLPYPPPPARYSRPVPVTALAFSPDGETLAASGYHEITLWNPADGHLLGRITNIAERPQSLAFSPDGTRLAMAGGSPGKSGEARVVDPATGSTLHVLNPATDLALAVAFSPDGTQLAVGGTDNAIRLFNVADGTQRLLIEQHADWVTDVAFSPDGAQLVSASRDKSARVFDVKTGSMSAAYLDHADFVLAAVFAMDGKSVYSAGRDRKVHHWSLPEAKKEGQLNGFGDEVYRLVVTPLGVLSACADGKVRLHANGRKDVTRTFEGLTDRAYTVVFDAKHQRVAAGDHGGAITVWNANDGSIITKFIAAPGYHSGQATK